MKEHTTVNGWLGELASKAGLDGLQLDERGCCALRYSEDLDVMMELPEHSPVLHLYAPVLSLISASATLEATFRQLLGLNLFALETRGATFALDETNERIVLQYQIVIEGTNSGQFERIIGNFLEAAVIWKQKLAGGNSENGAERTDAAAEDIGYAPFFVRV